MKFEEYKNCSDRKGYQRKCNIYLLRSKKREMYLQKVKKSTLPIFDDKRCSESSIKIFLWK